MNTKANSGRLTVRDARFTEEYAAQWRKRRTDGLPVYEVKTENIIDRNRGAALHPRTQERVPAGALFQVELVLRVFEGDDSERMVKDLKNALAIIQRFDSLGAGGSRGSGRVAFRNFREEKIALSSLTL